MNRPCPHLAPAVNKLLSAGAMFVAVSPANGDFRFVHELSKGPVPQIAAELAKLYDIEYWVNKVKTPTIRLTVDSPALVVVLLLRGQKRER